MKHAIAGIVCAAVLAALSVACGSNPANTVTLEEQVAKHGFTIGQPVRSIINFQLSSWNSVDHKHVIMNFGASRYYLVTLRTSCDGLRSATMITFSTTIGNLTNRDKLLVRNESHHLSQCYISTINELEKIRNTGNEH